MPNLTQGEDLMMESPLDVLSRAASMVETGEIHAIREAAMKRPPDRQGSPEQVPPNKMIKLQRIQDRFVSRCSPPAPQISPNGHNSPNGNNSPNDHQSPPALHNSPSAVQNSPSTSPDRRCAGTQTSFSSFVRDGYPSEGHTEEQQLLDLDTAKMQRHYNHQASSHKTTTPQVDSDHNTPLNLSKSGSNSPQPRPTVITCMNRSYIRGPLSMSPQSDSEVCDPAIEEHFRRSLGHMYSGVRSPRTPEEPANGPRLPTPPAKAKVTTNSISTKEVQNILVTESVDDHFAKSLGAAWKQIKAKEQEESSEGSVDDHFAKALGATWHKIKEGSDTASRTSSSRSPSPSSQHFARSLGDSWNKDSPKAKYQKLDYNGSDRASLSPRSNDA